MNTDTINIDNTQKSDTAALCLYSNRSWDFPRDTWFKITDFIMVK